MSRAVNDSHADANSPATSGWRDLTGWIVLAWVVAWSAAYFHSAVLHRFPGLLDWVRIRP